MTRSVAWAWTLAMGLLFAGQAAADDLELGIQAVAPRGKQPELLLHANRAALNVVIALERSDGRKVNLQVGRMKAGQDKRVALEQPEGTFKWNGTLTATYAGAEEAATMPLTFETHVLPPPEVSVEEADLHMDERRLEVTMNRAARRLVYTVYGDDGEVIDRGDSALPDVPAGEKLPVTWRWTEARVLRIDVVGHDVHGMFSPTRSLFPWSLDIPHQDVNFPTGQATIPAEELPKVNTAVADIKKAIKRFGGIVNIRLYVGGHTDTVGGADSNEALSRARAESIARAMRKGGIKIPIHYQGFGEGMLKVETPDETENAENRRATYTLSVDEPAGRGGWKAL